MEKQDLISDFISDNEVVNYDEDNIEIVRGIWIESTDYNVITELIDKVCEGKAVSTSEKDLRVCEVIPRFFDPELNKPLPSKNDITFSDDVFIIDEDGMHGLAYYSFEDCQWKFHTDTLVDYNEVGHETKWKWYYPTFTVKDAF